MTWPFCQVMTERSFQGLSVAIETIRIVKELIEIWSNEVCDTRTSRSRGIHQSAEHLVSSRMPTLGPDSRLTTTEHTCQITLGLCLYYSQFSHLAQSCPRQSGRSLTAVGVQAAVINNARTDNEKTKNKVVVTLLLRGSTT